jgi:DNA-directed RNA polymerase specialized sigma24 family protein
MKNGPKPKPKNYVNNRDFYEDLKRYKKAVRKAKREKTDPPRISAYIGECIYLINNKLAKKYNFVSYTWLDEMVSDGIENCIMSVDNFDEKKSTNPFAYFTQIAWNAFIRRIAKEKKQQYIKHKNMQNVLDVDLFLAELGVNSQNNDYRSDEVIKSFEERETTKKKKKTKKKGVEKFEDREEVS